MPRGMVEQALPTHRVDPYQRGCIVWVVLVSRIVFPGRQLCGRVGTVLYCTSLLHSPDA
jgi:hypothetical protein